MAIDDAVDEEQANDRPVLNLVDADDPRGALFVVGNINTSNPQSPARGEDISSLLLEEKVKEITLKKVVALPRSTLLADYLARQGLQAETLLREVSPELPVDVNFLTTKGDDNSPHRYPVPFSFQECLGKDRALKRYTAEPFYLNNGLVVASNAVANLSVGVSNTSFKKKSKGSMVYHSAALFATANWVISKVTTDYHSSPDSLHTISGYLIVGIVAFSALAFLADMMNPRYFPYQATIQLSVRPGVKQDKLDALVAGYKKMEKMP